MVFDVVCDGYVVRQGSVVSTDGIVNTAAAAAAPACALVTESDMIETVCDRVQSCQPVIIVGVAAAAAAATPALVMMTMSDMVDMVDGRT